MNVRNPEIGFVLQMFNSRRASRGGVRATASAAVCAAMGLVAGRGAAAQNAATQDSAAVPVLTLAQAIRMARQNAPQAVQARGAVQANRAAVRAAYGAFLPNVTASVGSARQFTGAGTTTRLNAAGERIVVQGGAWTYSNGISLNAQLFNAARVPNLRAARASVSAAEQSTVVQDYAVTVSVEQQFFAALAARESEDAARTQLAQAQEQLLAARRRVVAGAATASDSLTALVQVANAQLALATAQVNRTAANATLTRLVGSPVPVAASLTDPTIQALDSLAPDSASVVTLAVQGPAVQQARANLATAEAQRSAARATYFPTVNASYTRGGSGLDSRFGFGGNPYTYSGQLNIGLSWPLFNQFSREEQVARATVNQNNAAATLRDARLQARQLAVQDLDALRLGRQQVVVQAASILAARENLRVQRQRYDLGLATLVDVLTAQTTLNQAQANLITARNTVRLAGAQLAALVGRPVTAVAIPLAGTPR